MTFPTYNTHVEDVESNIEHIGHIPPHPKMYVTYVLLRNNSLRYDSIILVYCILPVMHPTFYKYNKATPSH